MVHEPVPGPKADMEPLMSPLVRVAFWVPVLRSNAPAEQRRSGESPVSV